MKSSGLPFNTLLALFLTMILMVQQAQAMSKKHYTFAEEVVEFNFDIKLKTTLNKSLHVNKGQEMLRVYRHAHPEYVSYKPVDAFSITTKKFGSTNPPKSIDFEPSQMFGRTHRIKHEGKLRDAVCIANCPGNNKSKKDPVLVVLRETGQVGSAHLYFYELNNKSKDKAAYTKFDMFRVDKVTNNGHMKRHVIQDIKPWEPSDKDYISVIYDGINTKGFPTLRIIDHIDGRKDKVTTTATSTTKVLRIKGNLRLRIMGADSNASATYIIEDTPERTDPYQRLKKSMRVDANLYLPGLIPNSDYPYIQP